MKKEDKERVVAELTERLRTTETLLVADYRGLTMPQIDELRSKLIEHGARFAVVKNTLTRRAAEAAGSDTLLALLEGPTAIAFLESDGDPVAVAKALVDAARETRVLEIAPLTGILALFTAPLQDLYGLIDARIEQLEAQGDTSGAQASGSEPQSAQPAEEPAAEAEPEGAEEASGSEPQSAETAETEPETETEEEDN